MFDWQLVKEIFAFPLKCVQASYVGNNLLFIGPWENFHRDYSGQGVKVTIAS
jgi:hypothetical protein